MKIFNIIKANSNVFNQLGLLNCNRASTYLYHYQTCSFVRKVNSSNYDLYQEKIKNLAQLNQKPTLNQIVPDPKAKELLSKDQSLPTKTKKEKKKRRTQQDEIDEQLNTLKILPYFEGKVNSKILDPDNIPLKEKTTFRRTPKISKKILKRKLDSISTNVKRKLHDNEIFRNGLSAEELEGHSPLVKRAMSIDNANIKEFRQARLLEIRKLYV
jgi:hypothetical protein